MGNNHLSLMATAIFLAFSPVIEFVGAQEAQPGQSQIDEINKRYQQEYDKIKAEADELKGFKPNAVEGLTNSKLEITKKTVEIKFDTPSVDMRIQEIKLHLPQITMKTRKIAFDVPRFEWDTTNIGPVKLDLPQIYSDRVEIKMDIPEFTWEVTSIKTKIPEFYMNPQRITFEIPEFTLRDVKEEIGKIEDKSNELQARSKELSKRQMIELADATEITFLQIEEEITVQRDAAISQIDKAIVDLEKAITDVKYYGMNPEAVRGADGSTTNLLDQLSMLRKQREQIIGDVNASLQTLTKEKAAALDALKGG
ncbi:hypothetical protein [Sinorhizobium meliloti]|uniref:hypothetical protein n=1 Tax=Rhizobium meliloti TaxID=382 RepID=UPI00299D9790|nr:hypothetical protein [Sinorhizobium meliloti]